MNVLKEQLEDWQVINRPQSLTHAKIYNAILLPWHFQNQLEVSTK